MAWGRMLYNIARFDQKPVLGPKLGGHCAWAGGAKEGFAEVRCEAEFRNGGRPRPFALGLTPRPTS